MPSQALHESIRNELDFASSGISCAVLRNANNESLTGRSIVLNLGPTDACIHAEQPTALAPLESVTVMGCAVSGENLVVIDVVDETLISADARQNWSDFYGSRATVEAVPELLRSPQLAVARVSLNKAKILRQSDIAADPVNFEVRLNLWFSPAGTACGIHNEHDFIEVHTQVVGSGRMQKFHARSAETMYEELVISVGNTHPPHFCREVDGRFSYPWHQYFADTDCVWLAVEYHTL